MLLPYACFPDFSPEPKINNARLLLSKLRGGDYAHVGEKEATSMVVQRVLQLSPGIQTGRCLDVGSGFGGTANDIYHMGFHSIQGVDIDEAAVLYAKQHYPQIPFIHAEADEISNLFEPESFSFICLFNVMYAIEDKPLLLIKLSAVAKTGAILAIFDYTAKDGILELQDLAAKPMYPIALDSLPENLKISGWEVLEVVDLSQRYLTWYRNLLDKLLEERQTLSRQFSQADITRVQTTFSSLAERLENSSLGGVVIYCRKSNERIFSHKE